ncbi:uncharacterized protein LOC111118896 [Crassostrea virginica]|uniref:Uncharacterized protein LOC111118334 n=1 Tax=Crassostrea virginica TaxID=6565 RepID=A0A8B8CCE7_CRAVI|nr:uncharacterized protein LOC111118334 [Crassostrea virginica]
MMNGSTNSRTNSWREKNNNETEQSRAQWSTQSFTAEDIVQQFTLPQIVKCNQQAILVKREVPLPINLAQPLLLHDKRTIRKLLARNVVLDPATQRYSENDETVVIPSDYDGLFLRLQSRTAKDHTCHRSIESLAKYKVRAFLNLSKMAAFQISKNPQSNDYIQINYTSGNVFLVDKVFLGTARVKSESILSRKSTQVQQMKYLKCRDEKDVEVLIPMSQPGEFIEALPSPVGNGRMSVNAESLIATQKFPIVVRFLSGRNRPRLTSFSGLFTLLDSFEETTLFGCILDPHGFTMLELPVSSPLTFQLALNTHDLYSHPVVKKALRLCDAKGQAYFRELKYKFKFAQRILQISGRRIEPEDENDPGDPPSAANSAKFGVTTTYIYL